MTQRNRPYGNFRSESVKPKPKERPILFSGEMVRAILSGAKTQTRRIVKPQPEFGLERCHYTKTGWAKSDEPNDRGVTACTCRPIACPYGTIGDCLRISEEVTVKPVCEDWYSVLFHADKSLTERPCDTSLMAKIKSYKTGHLRGVHLPSAYSRPIRMEITGVRIERLQGINRGDCMAEGCPFQNIAKETDPQKWFSDLWQSINGPDSWDANPWVWIIEFRRVEQ